MPARRRKRVRSKKQVAARRAKRRAKRRKVFKSAVKGLKKVGKVGYKLAKDAAPELIASIITGDPSFMAGYAERKAASAISKARARASQHTRKGMAAYGRARELIKANQPRRRLLEVD